MSLTSQVVSPFHILVLMPLRDDWVCAAELVRRLEKTIGSYPCTLDILLVDDGSATRPESGQFQGNYAVIRHIDTLRLRRNLGHQRAIAVGLSHAHKNSQADAILVMDSDGEDTAEGALQLITNFDRVHQRQKGVFAERIRRTESLTFRVFYHLYRIVHLLLTGIAVRVGNFSILPISFLGRLTVMSELWNHYAAAVFRSSLPISTVPVPRGHRISGKSTMNFVSLVVHGISAISVFGDVVGVRVLIFSMAGSVVAICGIFAVLSMWIFTNSAIPGWASYAIGSLMVILIQFITIAVGFTFTMLSNRVNAHFIPLRDHELFVAGTSCLYSVVGDIAHD
jgi:hypothetical protein